MLPDMNQIIIRVGSAYLLMVFLLVLDPERLLVQFISVWVVR